MNVPALPPYWSTHTHSRYSMNDALPQVAAMVSAAEALGYPALGLTDHGNVIGTVELYKNCRKKGMEPLPGVELYVVADRNHKKQGKMHITVNAFSERGYRNLVHLANMTARNFFYKPVVDLADFAQMSDDGMLSGLVVGTGCYFGVVQQTLINQGPREAKQIVRALARWFPRVLVELHHHNVDRADQAPEEEISAALIQIADELDLPYIIASDAHYLYPEEQPVHEGLKELVSFSDDPSEAKFPGGPYCLLDNDMLKRMFEPHVVARSAANLRDLADRAHVRLPELESFSLKVPDVTFGKDPQAILEEKVWAAFFKAGGVVGSDEFKRVQNELEVVRISGMAGYLLLVEMVCTYMREHGIWFHTRGSASGSYLCYLLKITQVDPIFWGLRMDRFMSTDRTRPPDIDLDVEHTRRDEVIAMLDDQFYVVPVGNYMQYGITEELDPNGESDGKGSLLVKYHSVIAKKHGKDPNRSKRWEDIPREDKALLQELAVRKLISGQSKHAAGYIVAPDATSIRQLPLSYIASSKTMVTAYDKKGVEALGFCKLDLLGLKTKTAVRVACEAINPEDPYAVYDSIPMDDKPTLTNIGKGKTEGTFQLSGYTMMRGCRDMKPRSTADIVAAQAIYRPAILKAKLDQTYLKRRRKQESIPEHHRDILEVTKDTFGIALYQEQIIDLCRRIGMSADELTDTLDAVKASNAGTADAEVFLKSIEARVGDLAAARGWNVLDVAWLVDGLAGYAEYSFNKAHSASYGVEGYRTAYLATHHPLEFWCGVLVAYSNSKKEVEHVRSARAAGITIRMAHVNKSGVTYKIDRNSIRKGLLSIKGVGPVAAEELAAKAPYKSLTDLGERVIPRKVSGAKGLALKKPPVECGGVIASLWDYGALEGLEAE